MNAPPGGTGEAEKVLIAARENLQSSFPRIHLQAYVIEDGFVRKPSKAERAVARMRRGRR